MANLWRRLSRTMRTRRTVYALGTTLIFVGFLQFTLDHNNTDTLSHRETTSNQKESTSKSILAKSHNREQGSTKEHDETRSGSSSVLNNLTSHNKSHINPYPFQIVMSTKPCTDEDLVIIVHSAVQFHKRRMLMRNTWLNQLNLQKSLAMKVKIVFITGMSTNKITLTKLSYEQELYGDILQSDFIDSYQNNTYKAISFLRWVSSEEGCLNASMILKVDDDALIHSVHLPKLKSTIQKALDTHHQHIYLGRLLTTVVNRDNTSKWGVSYDIWPHERYPVWFQGLAYMLTPQLAAKLHPVALSTSYMFTDDVYVGVLVSQIKDVHIIVENLIGTHTQLKLANLLKSFLEDGGMFYHVPNIEYFFTWYYLDSRSISVDPQKKRVLPQTHPRTRPHPHPNATASTNIGLLITLVFVISFFGGMLLLTCYLYEDAENHTSSKRTPTW